MARRHHWTYLQSVSQRAEVISEGVNVTERATRRRLLRLQQELEVKPYWRLLGVGAEQIDEGYARLRMPLAAEVRNSASGGTAHGGALASLVDMAVGTALDSLDLPDMAGRATIELSVTYLEAAEGEAIIAQGRMLRVGRSVAVGEAELRDVGGRLVAKGRATYTVRRRPASQS